MALKLITPPASEPVSLEEAKAYLRIDTADDDATISGLIRAAREYCEAFQNRAYITQVWQVTYDDFPDMPILLPKPPLVSVESVTCVDDAGVDVPVALTDILVDTVSEPGRIAFKSGKTWPAVTLQGINGVKIRFTAGYGDATAVPQNVKQAIMLYVAHRYENPESEDVPEAVHSLLWPDRMVAL